MSITQEVSRMYESVKRIFGGGQSSVQEFSQLECVDAQNIERYLESFQALFEMYNNIDNVGIPENLHTSMENTHATKRVLQKLPSINDLFAENHDNPPIQRFRRFLKAVYKMKRMANVGGGLRRQYPEMDALTLDEQHPEALLFHLEAGISDEGLSFATTLHLIEMYLNKIYAESFTQYSFNPRKDWLTDVCMELMIANESLPVERRNERIHELYVLVNETLGWIKGYSHIQPALREEALFDPLEANGFEVVYVDVTNLEEGDDLVRQLVEFDQTCFQGSPTGSPEHTPPLLTAKDVISGVKEHANRFVVLKKDRNFCVVLQVCQREKRHDVHIMSLAVHPKHRSQGLAKTLLDWVDAETEKLGENVITLRVDPNNTPALKQYLRQGFVVAGVRSGIKDHPNVVTLALTKRLDVQLQYTTDEEKRVSVNNLNEINELCSSGFRGMQIEQGDEDSLLVMKKIDEQSKDKFPVWS